jgi:hypothetical protein
VYPGLERNPKLAGDDSALLAAARRAGEANVRTLLLSLALGTDPLTLDVPDGNLELVQNLAQRPDGLPLILRAYQVGLAAFRHVWIDHIAQSVNDSGRLARLIIYTDTHITACADQVSDVLTERWVELERDARTADIRRAAMGRALLAGQSANLSDIGHPGDRAHLVIAARSATSEPGDPTRLLVPIAGALGAVHRIEAIAPNGAAVWWIASPGSTLDRGSMDRALKVAPAGWWCVATISPPGVTNLISAAEDVRAGLEILPLTSPQGGAVAHSEIALVTTLLADPARATRFARSVLGSLADDTDRSARLRATLSAYFAAAERKAGAAALLGIHEKTVAYRLRTAERELGTSILAHRTDIEAALLVRATQRLTMTAI